MAQGKHVGKVVVAFSFIARRAEPLAPLRSQGERFLLDHRSIWRVREGNRSVACRSGARHSS